MWASLVESYSLRMDPPLRAMRRLYDSTKANSTPQLQPSNPDPQHYWPPLLQRDRHGTESPIGFACIGGAHRTECQSSRSGSSFDCRMGRTMNQPRGGQIDLIQEMWAAAYSPNSAWTTPADKPGRLQPVLQSFRPTHL